MPARPLDLANVRFIFDKQFIHFIAIIVQKNFVQTVRAVEICMGIPVPGIKSPSSPRLGAAKNVTSAFAIAATLSSIFNSEVLQVLTDAIPVFEQVAEQLDLNTAFAEGGLRWLLSRRRALVTKYVISFTGRGFYWWFVVGLCRSVSWISAGSTTTPQTQLTQLLTTSKPMIIIYIIRMYKPSKICPTLILCSNRFGVCYYIFLRLVVVIDLLSRESRIQMKRRIWHMSAVSLFLFLSPLAQKLNNALDLNRTQSDAELRNSPLWFGGNITYIRNSPGLISRSSLRRMGLVDPIRRYRWVPLQVGRCSKVLVQQRCWVDRA